MEQPLTRIQWFFRNGRPNVLTSKSSRTVEKSIEYATDMYADQTHFIVWQSNDKPDVMGDMWHRAYDSRNGY